MEVLSIKYGESYFYENWVIPNGNPDKKLNIIFQVFLIKYKDKMVLVDAGCETMPGFEMSNFCGSVKALEQNGVLPEQITDVIITHSHHDHIECVKYFKNAVIHIQKDEYEEGKHFIPNGFKVSIFEDEYTLYGCIKITKIGRHSIGSCVVEIEDGKRNYVIIGDECYLRKYLKNNSNVYEKFDNEKNVLLFSHDI